MGEISGIVMPRVSRSHVRIRTASLAAVFLYCDTSRFIDAPYSSIPVLSRLFSHLFRNWQRVRNEALKKDVAELALLPHFKKLIMLIERIKMRVKN